VKFFRKGMSLNLMIYKSTRGKVDKTRRKGGSGKEKVLGGRIGEEKIDSAIEKGGGSKKTRPRRGGEPGGKKG